MDENSQSDSNILRHLKDNPCAPPDDCLELLTIKKVAQQMLRRDADEDLYFQCGLKCADTARTSATGRAETFIK